MTTDLDADGRSELPTTDGPAPAAPRFWLVLGLLVLVGLGLRIGYVLAVARDVPLGNDATWYFLQSGSIADGAGFIDPEQRFATGAEVATAGFPPLFPAWLAVVRTFGFDSVLALQLAGAVAGSATVVLTGLLGRRLAGPTVGLVAAGLATVSPTLLAGDGSLMTESVYVPIVLAVLLLADRARTDRTWAWWVALGIAAGAAALTRQEALLIALVIVVPAALLVRARSWPWRIGRLAIAGAAMLVVVTPWVARNQQQVGELTISTASPATSLAGSNCDSTYSGPSIGSWDFACTGSELRTTMSEAAWTTQVRNDAIAYARDHAGRLVVVAPAREARVWGLWDPRDLVVRDASETRSERFQYVVWATGIVTLVGGLAGVVLLGRRHRRIAVLVGALSLVAITAVLSHGNPRFRTVAEPALLIGLAAVIVTVARAWRGRASARTGLRSVTPSASVRSDAGSSHGT